MSSEQIPPRLSAPIIRTNADGTITPSIFIDFGTSSSPAPPLQQVEPTTFSPTLDLALRRAPPSHLWHYTSADGLVSILKSTQIWASNIAFLNDTKEIEHAVDYAKNAIGNRLNRTDLTSDERLALEEMSQACGSAAKRYYVASFSEDQDLLSQWRAYCPPGGGYSLGISSEHLLSVSRDQQFLLSPCIYDHRSQYQIMVEFTEFFLQIFRERALQQDDQLALRKNLAWEFAQHVTRFGPTLKHPTFQEEREWRLISPMVQEPHPHLDFRGTPSRVVPFYKFSLSTEAHPDLVRAGTNQLTTIVGPTSDRDSSGMAVQFLMTSLFGTSRSGSSEVPYRAW